MIDRDAIEKSLLLNIIVQQKWNSLILNGINKDFFTPANKSLYDYILNTVNLNKYPDIHILAHDFNLDDEAVAFYLQVSDIDALCMSLKNDYLKDQIEYKVKELNNHQQELITDPKNFVQRIGNVYNELRFIDYDNKAKDILDNIEKVDFIDPSNVISTGFKELDEILVRVETRRRISCIYGETWSR